MPIKQNFNFFLVSCSYIHHHFHLHCFSILWERVTTKPRQSCTNYQLHLLQGPGSKTGILKFPPDSSKVHKILSNPTSCSSSIIKSMPRSPTHQKGTGNENEGYPLYDIVSHYKHYIFPLSCQYISKFLPNKIKWETHLNWILLPVTLPSLVISGSCFHL